MEATLIALVIILVFSDILLIVYFLSKKHTGQESAAKNANSDALGLKLVLEQVNELSRTMDTKMSGLNQSMSDNIHRQFSESKKIISDVTEKLGKLDETNRQVVGFADQLQSLQDILKNPKQRGILGEYYLETLLKNVLPPGSYAMQYPFPHPDESGRTVIVDAAVFVKDKIIPIDSKFSLENYNRIIEEKNEAEKVKLEKIFVSDLKNRIIETAKYVQPTQGTMDFAFMFIPHEAIYYDLLVNKIGALKDEDTENFIQRAASKYKVIIVSPTSFLAYLQTVLQGLRALTIEESVKDVIKRVGELDGHLLKYQEYHNKLGTSLGTVVSHFNSSNREFRKIDKDVTRIVGADAKLLGIEAIALEKPEVEE